MLVIIFLYNTDTISKMFFSSVRRQHLSRFFFYCFANIHIFGSSIDCQFSMFLRFTSFAFHHSLLFAITFCSFFRRKKWRWFLRLLWFSIDFFAFKKTRNCAKNGGAGIWGRSSVKRDEKKKLPHSLETKVPVWCFWKMIRKNREQLTT